MGKSNTRVELQYKIATREKHTQGEYVSMTKLSKADRYWRSSLDKTSLVDEKNFL